MTSLFSATKVWPGKVWSTNVRRVALAIAALAATSCGPSIDADNPVVLSSFDPELLTDAQTLVFSFSTTKTCADLMDQAPDELGELLAPEGAPLQLLAPDTEEHVFGKVTPGVPIAYFVLASVKAEFGQRVEFGEFKGTVFAMGCRDLTVTSGSRQDLPLTLFPVGLR